MAPTGSSVLIRLALIGAAATASDTTKVSRALKVLGDSADGAGAGLERTGAGADVATGALARVQAVTDATKARLGSLAAAGGTVFGVLKRISSVVGLGAGFGIFEGVKGLIDLQKQMELIHTQADATQGEVNRMTKAVIKLGPAVGTLPNTLALGLYHIESVGIRGANALKVLTVAAKGAMIGGANLEDVTNALDASIVSGIKGVKNYGQTMGVLNAIVGTGDMRMQDLADAFGSNGLLAKAKRFGVTIKQVGAVLAVFGDNNIRGSAAGNLLARTLFTMAAPSAAAAKGFAAIGLNEKQLGADMLHGGLIKALVDLKAHMKASGLAAPALNLILSRAFGGGKSAGGVLLLLNQLGRLPGKLAAITKGSTTFGKAWTATTHTLSFQADRMKATLDSIFLRLATKLVPAASKGLSTANSFISGLLNPNQKHLVGPANQGIMAGMGGAAGAGQNTALFIISAFKQLKSTARAVFPAVVKYVGQLLKALAPAAPFLKNVLLPLFIGMGKGLAGAVLISLKLLVPVVKAFATALGALGKILGPFKPEIEALGIVLGVAFAPKILGLLGSVPKLGGVFRLLAAPIKLLTGGAKLLGGAGRILAGGISDAALHLGRFAGTLSPGIVRSAILKVTNLVGGITNAFTGLGPKLKGVISKVFGSGGSIVTAAKAAGGNVVAAIAGAIEGVSAVALLTGALEFLVGAALVAVANKIAGNNPNIKKPSSGVDPSPGTSTLGGWEKKAVNFLGGVFSGIATGGVVKSSGWAVVGERGPELAHFGRGTTVYSNRESRRGAPVMGATHGHWASQPVILQVDGRTLHEAVYRVERRFVEAT